MTTGLPVTCSTVLRASFIDSVGDIRLHLRREATMTRDQACLPRRIDVYSLNEPASCSALIPSTAVGYSLAPFEERLDHWVGLPEGRVVGVRHVDARQVQVVLLDHDLPFVQPDQEDPAGRQLVLLAVDRGRPTLF